MTLKLYVWEGVLSDYTDGLAVALASSVEEARALLTAKIGWEVKDIHEREPAVVEHARAFYVYGG